MCLMQIQGSTIGNQISPTLCSIPVIVRELRGKQSYNLWLHNFQHNLFVERYVDNRFAIFKKLLLHQPAIIEFRDEWFYNKPVQLEEVPDTHFLGANVHIDARMVTPIIVSEPWQLRTPQSAGSLQALLSPFQARGNIILQQTFPKSHIPHHLNTLKQAYIKAGFYSKDLQPIIDKLLRKAGIQPTQPPSASTTSQQTTLHQVVQSSTLFRTFQPPTASHQVFQVFHMPTPPHNPHQLHMNS